MFETKIGENFEENLKDFPQEKINIKRNNSSKNNKTIEKSKNKL